MLCEIKRLRFTRKKTESTPNIHGAKPTTIIYKKSVNSPTKNEPIESTIPMRRPSLSGPSTSPSQSQSAPTRSPISFMSPPNDSFLSKMTSSASNPSLSSLLNDSKNTKQSSSSVNLIKELEQLREKKLLSASNTVCVATTLLTCKNLLEAAGGGGGFGLKKSTSEFDLSRVRSLSGPNPTPRMQNYPPIDMSALEEV